MYQYVYHSQIIIIHSVGPVCYAELYNLYTGPHTPIQRSIAIRGHGALPHPDFPG